MQRNLIQKLTLLTGLSLFLIAGCAHQQESSQEAESKLNETFGEKIGVAKKSELVEHFGTAQWCRPNDFGGETCRFYRKKGTQWVGEKRQKTSYLQYDEGIAVFDQDGILKRFTGGSQR